MSSGPIDRRETLQWLGALACVVGIGSATTAIAQSGASDDEDSGGEDSDDEDDQNTAAADVAVVTFDSQTVPAGEEQVSVVVERAVLPDGGYVVVHNELLLTENDPVGSIVGVSEYYEPGTATNVEVEVFADGIVDADEDGAQTLVAMPHTEDGDSEDDPTFEFPNEDEDDGRDDTPYVDEQDTNDDGTEVVVDQAEITFVYGEEEDDDEDDEYGYGDDEYGDDERSEDDYEDEEEEEEDDDEEDEEREYEDDEEDEEYDEDEEREYDDEEEDD